MASFSRTNTPVIRRPSTVDVYINGRLRRGVELVNCGRTSGVTPSGCELYLPYSVTGDDTSWLEDAEVVVYGADLRAIGSGPIFRGYVDMEKSVFDAEQNRVRINALSILDIMDRVFVGQASDQISSWLPQYNPMTNQPLGWTLESVVHYILGDKSLNSGWRSKVEVGNTSALKRVRVDIPLPDLRFTAQTVRAALARVMAYAPDITFRERFAANKTFIDFHSYGDRRNGLRTILFPVRGVRSTADGAFGKAFQKLTDSKRIYTRVVGTGAPKEHMITLSTNHTTAPILPGWEGATHPVSWGFNASFFNVTEQAVLKNPYETMKGPRENEARQRIFRRYRLPKEIVSVWKASQDNVYRIAGDGESLPGADIDEQYGPRIGVQVFMQKLIPTTPIADNRLDWVVATDEYELITGARVNWAMGEVWLPHPNVGLRAYYRSAGGLPVSEFVALQLFVTISVSTDQVRWSYDTGVKGFTNHPTINASGLTFPFSNDSIKYQLIGTEGDGLVDALGNFHEFDVRWYDEQERQWYIQATGTNTVLRSDLRWLSTLAENALRERWRRRTMVSVSLPYFDPYYQPGDNLRVVGRGIDSKTMTVVSCYAYADRMDTTILASDEIPLSVNLQARAPSGYTDQQHGMFNDSETARMDRLAEMLPGLKRRERDRSLMTADISTPQKAQQALSNYVNDALGLSRQKPAAPNATPQGESAAIQQTRAAQSTEHKNDYYDNVSRGQDNRTAPHHMDKESAL